MLATDLFFDYTLRVVALGAAVLGVVAGALGSFAVLRKQSLLGDAMSHAALPGVVLVFLLTGLKTPLALMIGAAMACVLAALFILAVTRATRIKEDSSLGVVLAVFFGFGVLLLSVAQRNPDARQAGLNKFLFGQAATLLASDVLLMALFGGVALTLMLLFWKEFKLLAFDREYGATIGLPMRWLEILITLLLVIAIVIGLQAVGVVLMSAMIVAPAAAARQWTDRLSWMAALAALFGAVGGVSGTVVSSLGDGFSTGPAIVLAMSIIVLVSLLLAPNRGVAWKWLAQQRRRRRLQSEQVLSNLYRLAIQHDDWSHPHSWQALRIMGDNEPGVRASLAALESRGLARRVDAETWALTPAGFQAARALADDASDVEAGGGAVLVNQFEQTASDISIRHTQSTQEQEG